MREIKFRQYFSGVPDQEDSEWQYFDVYRGNAIRDGYFEDPQQYTGLKDKNGREIYEGDIIRNYHMLFEVTWHVGAAQFGLNMLYAEDEGNHIHSSRTPLRDWNWCSTPRLEADGKWDRNKPTELVYGINLHGNSRRVEACEVIGNIYENPELLESK